MTTRRIRTSTLVVDGLHIELRRGRVKAARLGVRPDGSIRLSAPERADEGVLEDFVRQHKDWLLQQRERYRLREAPVEDLRDGGRLLLWGEWRAVQCTVGPRARAELRDGVVSIVAPDDSSAERAVAQLRRREVQTATEALVPRCERLLGVSAAGYRYRAMTSRWGTCNLDNRQITLNTWLAQRPVEELEYVLVHELAHFHSPGHGADFRRVMDQALPGWPEVRRQLQAHLPPRG